MANNPFKGTMLIIILALGVVGVIGWVLPGGSKPDALNECTTSTCYPNPTYWIINAATFQGNGVCTTSASYVEIDGGANPNGVITITVPTFGLSGGLLYVIFSFDAHVTLAGTTGKLTIFDTQLGLPPIGISREMVVAGVGLGSDSGSLQASISLGPGVSDTFGVAGQRTAGTGQLCIDSIEATGYPFEVGGNPAP